MRRSFGVAILVMFAGSVTAVSQPLSFLPDGGIGLFEKAFPTQEARQEALSRHLTADEWQATLAETGLTATETQTLASYLSHVAPQTVTGTDPVASLPEDGRVLALNQCQSCHSLFSGYLMQRRDRTGWMTIFASPFHSKIPMTDVQKAIFADYSAINMPMRIEDIPPEMRF